MFTRQHYKAIAEIISRNQDRLRVSDVADCENGLPCIHLDIIGDLTDYFAKDNPQFDRERFLAACEL